MGPFGLKWATRRLSGATVHTMKAPTRPRAVAAANMSLMNNGDTTQKIRSVLAEYGRLGPAALELQEDADLRQAGLTSHASVNVMLALESASRSSSRTTC